MSIRIRSSPAGRCPFLLFQTLAGSTSVRAWCCGWRLRRKEPIHRWLPSCFRQCASVLLRWISSSLRTARDSILSSRHISLPLQSWKCIPDISLAEISSDWWYSIHIRWLLSGCPSSTGCRGGRPTPYRLSPFSRRHRFVHSRLLPKQGRGLRQLLFCSSWFILTSLVVYKLVLIQYVYKCSDSEMDICSLSWQYLSKCILAGQSTGWSVRV